MRGFWPVEELAELANGPTGFGEEAKGVCLFVCLEFQCGKVSCNNEGGKKG